MTAVAPPIPAARPVFSPEDRAAIADLVDRALVSGSLTLGPVTEQFEAAVAEQTGAAHAIAVASGTAALEIALRSVDVADRDVVVPTNTFFATAAAVVHAGGRAVLADIDATTAALSCATVEAAITPATRAVVAVHIGGLVTPEIRRLRRLCDDRGIVLVEDAAHAHGATFDGQAAGTFGTVGTLSFYPTKVITSGEGGMILTDDAALRDDARIYRDQGKAGFLGGEHVRMGYAWRMSEVHAAIGLTQWRHLADFVAARRAAAAVYDEALLGCPGIEPLAIPAACSSNYYKYVALLGPGIDRESFKRTVREEHGVSMSGEVYNLPLHRQPVFAGLATDGLAAADEFCSRHVCLPVHSDMTHDEAGRVAAAVRDVASSLAG